MTVYPAHSWVHLLTGVFGIWAAISARPMMPLGFTWFVLIAYGLLTLSGFFMAYSGGMWLGLFPLTMADNWLHAMIAVSAIAVILASQRRTVFR
jgi:hypothetical protein